MNEFADDDDTTDNGNWSWTSKSAAEMRRNWTRATVHEHDDDPGVKLLRYVVEVWLTTPIVLLGIVGNVVAFFVLCHLRRHKLQTTTTILQVTQHTHATTVHLPAVWLIVKSPCSWPINFSFYITKIQRHHSDMLY